MAFVLQNLYSHGPSEMFNKIAHLLMIYGVSMLPFKLITTDLFNIDQKKTYHTTGKHVVYKVALDKYKYMLYKNV